MDERESASQKQHEQVFLLVSGSSTWIFGLVVTILLSFIWLNNGKTFNFIYLVMGGVLSFGMIALTVKHIKVNQRFSRVSNESDKSFYWNLLIVLIAIMVNRIVWSICGLVQWKNKTTKKSSLRFSKEIKIFISQNKFCRFFPWFYKDILIRFNSEFLN